MLTLEGPSPEYETFERALKTLVRPVLVGFDRLPFRGFTAEEFVGSKLLKRLANGRLVSVFQGSGLSFGSAGGCLRLFGQY